MFRFKVLLECRESLCRVLLCFTLPQPRHAPLSGYSLYQSLFQIQLVPDTACSRYSLFQIQLVPDTACSRYSLFQIQLVPDKACSRVCDSHCMSKSFSQPRLVQEYVPCNGLLKSMSHATACSRVCPMPRLVQEYVPATDCSRV